MSSHLILISIAPDKVIIIIATYLSIILEYRKFTPIVILSINATRAKTNLLSYISPRFNFFTSNI